MQAPYFCTNDIKTTSSNWKLAYSLFSDIAHYENFH